MARGRTAPAEADAQAAQPKAQASAEESASAQPAETRPTRRNTTTYVIFTAPEESGPFTRMAEQQADSQVEALKVAIDGREDDQAFMSQYFVAVAASSFKPKQPKVTTNVNISF